MERFMEFFKRHPVGIAVAVVAAVLLIYMMTRSSSDSSGGGVLVMGPSDATVAANAQIEAQRIAANATTAQAQITKEITDSNNAAAIQINSQNVAGATEINAAQQAAIVTQAQYAQNVALGAQSTELQMHEIDANTAIQSQLFAKFGVKGGSAAYQTASGQTKTIGIDNTNPWAKADSQTNPTRLASNGG